MNKKITLFYIKTKQNKNCIIRLEVYTDPFTLKNLNHLNYDYYIGFMGFDDNGEILKTPVSYDFYYFYNMVQDIRTVINLVKFKNNMTANELLQFENQRLKKLKKQRVLLTNELQNELYKYKNYENDMEKWIGINGSKGLKIQFYNNEDIKLSYIIERVAIENNILKKVK